MDSFTGTIISSINGPGIAEGLQNKSRMESFSRCSDSATRITVTVILLEEVLHPASMP